MKHKTNKPINDTSTPLSMTDTSKPMGEVVSNLPAEIKARTRIVAKPSKEELQAAIKKANGNLGKSAGHKTRY